MSYRLLLIMLLLPALARGGEPIITETADHITVEYTGTPSAAVEEKPPLPAAPSAPLAPQAPAPSRAELLAAQIVRLEKELAQLQSSSTEGDADSARKAAAIIERSRLIEGYRAQLARLSNPQQQDAGHDSAPLQSSLQNRRQAMKSEMRARRQMGATKTVP